MKKTIFISSLLLASHCFANINAIVSISPQKTFLSQIAKDKVTITTMVDKGISVHTYEPKPSDMKKITKADIYFSIGVEFEEHWLGKFTSLNKNMTISSTYKGIKKLTSTKHKNIKHKDEHLDPHIWTSPANVKIIATNMLNTLILRDSENKEFYTKNYNEFIKKVENTNNKIKEILSKKDTKNFMVFHPSWQYFANEYKLNQIPIEIEGKNPKPKTIRKLILEAKKNNIKAIFASPYKSNKMAKLISNELNIKVIKISPMEDNWSKTMIKMAKSI